VLVELGAQPLQLGLVRMAPLVQVPGDLHLRPE
jgi:hypothetical protein